MSVRVRVAKTIKTHRVLRILVGASISYVILSAVVFFASNLIITMTPRSYYYTYDSIEFVEKRGDFLVFASTRTVHQPYPMTFNDILRCGSQEFIFYSHQNSHVEKPITNHGLKKLLWNYAEPFPTDTPCTLESNMYMEVGHVKKSQTLVSDTFVVEGQSTTTPRGGDR